MENWLRVLGNVADTAIPAVRIEYVPLKGSEAEFMRQLAGQEAGINKLTAGEIRANIEAFNASGRPSSASDAI